ncbi:GNAT family N-acetyltransferase [Kutzneria albida]|uniref:N-acetyltransferase domain-containing protein n=1 Tax=Kutzneria albida DSM 43870 TaxID=1449976 RepID=W5WRT6_9PSEU|nr:GNAT family N-acetyltransferase [Kutzneria albida]AHI00890.1 hypothetical protein KALB_7532 [Kutzneria albida DSM 43870]
MAVTTRAAGSADIGQVAAVLGAAFQEDPVHRWLLPEPERRRRGLTPMFATMLRNLHPVPGGTDLAHLDGRPSAAAVWDPPGWSGKGQFATLRLVPGLLLAIGTRFKRVADLGELLGAEHPSEPHWYLTYLGTVPGAQGRGAGSALLRKGLARCDATGTPAYLESSDPANTGYYERFGFVTIGHVRLGEDLAVPRMWREPR